MKRILHQYCLFAIVLAAGTNAVTHAQDAPAPPPKAPAAEAPAAPAPPLAPAIPGVAAPLPAAVTTKAAATAATPSQLERIQNLIKDLDSSKFDTREEASAALAELGDIASDSLGILLETKPNAEVRRRASELLDKIRVARIARNPSKLEDLLEQVRLANRDKLDSKDLEIRLARVLEVLALATGKQDLKLPVQFNSVRAQGGNSMLRGALVTGSAVKVPFAQNSIILADTVAEISSAQDSIIIARVAVQVAHARNCILIAGESVSSSHVEQSVVLCGDKSKFSFIRTSVCGSRGDFSFSFCEGSFLVNSKVDAARLRDKSKVVQTPGLVLDVKQQPNPLADKLTITHASGSTDSFILFKLARGGGEYVARLNEEIKSPEGAEIAELKGWKVVHAGEIVVFRNGEQQVCMARK